VGEEIAAAAGWDPAGIAHALRTLDREEALHAGQSRSMSFFATHPPLPQRVEAASAHAGTLRRAASQPIAGSRADFLRRLDGLPVGARPGDGVVDGNRFAHPDLGFALRFPPGWTIENARGGVGAAAPAGDAAIALTAAGEGDDPEAALRSFEQAAKADLSSNAERFRIGDLPAVRTAARARSDRRPVVLELTWVALGGRIYRIAAAASASAGPTYAPAFRDTTTSFRRLTAAERSSFRETRLRVVAARPGETMAALLARAGATGWSPDMAAVANGVEPGTPLGARQLVKVPVAEPYRPR
jgi:predicted Zn-dependent protease